MTVVETWNIASEHITRRWWQVKVYDTAEALRKAAHRYQPRHGRGYWGPETVGCCQQTTAWVENGKDASDPANFIWPPNFAGVIRLVQTELWTEVIYHELLHAACAAYRMNVAARIDLGNAYGPEGDLSREEDLAYIYGQLAADMDSALRKRAG